MTTVSNLWQKVCMPLTQRTAQILSTKHDELQKIRWTDGEANTDSGFSTLACLSCKEAWNTVKERFPEFRDLSLELSAPDITIAFSKDSKPVVSAKIELKSGKGNGVIPGSTIGSLDINEPVIFCLRNDSQQTFQFRYSQYYDCIGETNNDMFQDRTPRPHVNFNKMTDISSPIQYIHKDKSNWVEHYARCALTRTKAKKPYKSWQDYLTVNIIKFFVQETSVDEFIKLKSEFSTTAQ